MSQYTYSLPEVSLVFLFSIVVRYSMASAETKDFLNQNLVELKIILFLSLFLTPILIGFHFLQAI